MRQIETSALTIEEAIRIALERLGVDEDSVEIEIINEGKTGVFGLGREEAHVRVSLLDDPHSDDLSIARKMLVDLLDRLGLPAEISVEQGEVGEGDEGQQPMVFDISGDELGILIGRRGQTLAALQYILRLMLSERLSTQVPLVIDVNGYKKRRYDSLRTLARHIAEQVTVSQRPFSLEPMPAYERRIVHMALSDHPSVTTQSVGFGEARKVTVLPKGKQYSQ
jgi:spoIIIJ-associated protein